MYEGARFVVGPTCVPPEFDCKKTICAPWFESPAMLAVFMYPLSLYFAFAVIAGWLVQKYAVVSLNVSTYWAAPDRFI